MLDFREVSEMNKSLKEGDSGVMSPNSSCGENQTESINSFWKWDLPTKELFRETENNIIDIVAKFTGLVSITTKIK